MKDDFTSDINDQYFKTGKYYQFDMERNKSGKFAYNADHIDETIKTNNNQYGSYLIGQMKSFQRRIIENM